MKTFELAAKKSKRKQFVKTVGLSILGLLVLTGGTLKTLQILTARNADKVYWQHELLSRFAYPNIEYSTYYYKATGMFAGAVHADRNKDLAGVPVAFGDYEYHYDFMGDYFDFSQDSPAEKRGASYDRQTWSKLPLFFNTEVLSSNSLATSPTDELPLVKEMSNQLVEVAITFDKPYSYGELQEILPSNLKQNWYWIGTQSKEDSTNFRIDQLFGLKKEDLQLYTHDPNLPGDAKEWQPFTSMKKLLELPQLSSYNSHLSDDIKAFLDQFGSVDFAKQEDIDRIEFAGVILTGRAEDFAQLENADWIYASSIGTSVQNQPYYQLEVN